MAAALRSPKHFLHVDDWGRDGFLEVMEKAQRARGKLQEMRGSWRPLQGRSMAMIFAKPSARTRVSFETVRPTEETGMASMGGHPIYLAPNDIQLGEREEIRDVARTLSRYNDCIMARLFGHDNLLELAKHATVPVINGLTDYNHPCQIAADALTIIDALGSLEGTSVCYVGDGNNVTHSWLRLAGIVPLKLTVACPEGFEPDDATLRSAEKAGVSEIRVCNTPSEGVKGADVVYTDVWASMGQKNQAAKREAIFDGFTVTERMLSMANPDAIFLHCLPAERGKECTEGVIEGSQSWVFRQAENRMHAQNAILLSCLGLGDDA